MRTTSVSAGVSCSKVFSRVKIGPWVRRDLWERFKIAARALGVDAQDLLNQAMEEWLKNHAEEIKEVVRRLGIEILSVNSPVNEEKKVVG